MLQSKKQYIANSLMSRHVESNSPRPFSSPMREEMEPLKSLLSSHNDSAKRTSKRKEYIDDKNDTADMKLT